MSLDSIAAKVRRCRSCRLSKSRTKAVPGEGSKAGIMLVGEAPGKDEDASGRPFVGRAGKVLDRLLKGIGLSRRQVFITSVIKCRPPKNRVPTAEEIYQCHPYLEEQIAAINPKIICPLGGVALKVLLGETSVEKARGRIIRFGGRVFIPMYHPAAVLYGKKKQLLEKDFQVLKRALQWV